jgi:transcriptional regulator with XRE-family HTH domain
VHVIMDGERVTLLREEQGLSKKGLAEAANVTQATMARAEDSRPMYPATVRRIAGALGVDPRTVGSRSQRS